MIFNSLSLQNFRGFKKKSFEFASSLTVIVGPNTSGKTNLLESISLLATGKSFKAEREVEMIGYGKEMARITASVATASSAIDLETILTPGQVGEQPAPFKKYLVNGVSRRQIDFVGNLRAVLFWPEDLEIITDSPSLRRKYLDMVLCQVDREYRRSLSAYEKGIRQRNRLLERIRDEGANPAQLIFWNQLLIKNGNILTEKREEFIDFVNESGSLLFAQHGRHCEEHSDEAISTFKNVKIATASPLARPRNDDKHLSISYSIEYDKSLISETRLEQYKNEEVAAAMTLVGPQRDDFKIKMGERDLAAYGSRGEQRMAILWLKLAELEYIFHQTGERPILLLDDIFSELDEAHRELVLEIIPYQQTIMTTTDLGLIDPKFLKSAKIIEL